MLKAKKILEEILKYISGFLLFVVAAALFAQTIVRFCFHYSIFWADELAKYSMIWGAFLCAAVGVAGREHTTLDFVMTKVSGVPRRIVAVLLDVVYMVFSCLLFYFSFSNVKLGMMQVTPGLGIPMGYVYVALTVSMVCMFFFLVFNLVEDIKALGKREEAAD